MSLNDRKELAYADERGRYKLFKFFREGETFFYKEIWVCCCGKEFKQHGRFHNHNCDNCFNILVGKGLI